MKEFWILIFMALFVTNLLDKAETVQLEEMQLQTFDELFVDEWWAKDEAEDLKSPAPTNFGQNVHHQIDRQNTQIGQTEPNLTDQLGQIEPNSTDQNPPLTESDHTSNEKRKIINKFHQMKEKFKQKGKYSKKERTQIEDKIAKDLKVNRTKIYKWKKEFGLSQINPKNERENLVEKFDQKKAELMRAGLKNTYPNQINETVAKELGLSLKTIYNWKKELGQTEPNPKYPHSEQKELMKLYYEIKDKNSKISDADIAKMFKIGRITLYNWKRQFKPNSVDGHSVEEIAGSNVQEKCKFGELLNE